MIETDRFRFYLVKYFLASLSVLQAAVAILMLFQYKASPKINATIFIFFSFIGIGFEKNDEFAGTLRHLHAE